MSYFSVSYGTALSCKIQILNGVSSVLLGISLVHDNVVSFVPIVGLLHAHNVASHGKHSMMVWHATSLPNGKKLMIRISKRRVCKNIFKYTELSVQNVSLSMRLREAVACILHALNANLSFVMDVKSPLKWGRNVKCHHFVLNWDCTLIIREIVCSIWEINNHTICRRC